MRQLICLLILICSLNFSAKAQDISIGGNLSLNTSWILNQNAYEILQRVCPEDPLIIGSEPGYALTLGYSVGGAFTYQTKGFLALSLELNYTKRGQNYKDTWTGNGCAIGDINNFKRKFALHYFELPLIAKFTTQKRKSVRGYGEIGLQTGILLNVQEKITIDSEDPGVNFSAARSKVKKLDVGLVIGGGLHIELNNNLYIKAGLRSYLGVLDLNNGDATAFISDNEDTYQQSRNFSLGLNFGIHYIFDWVGGLYN